jgi:hypothetical protein
MSSFGEIYDSISVIEKNRKEFPGPILEPLTPEIAGPG